MDGKYIFAIIILGLFFLLILISFAFLEYGRNKEEKLQAWISERYANKDLNKPDYDMLAIEEEIPVQNVSEQPVVEEAEANDEEEEEVRQIIDEAYGKIDVEGIEEITGNYDGNK